MTMPMEPAECRQRAEDAGRGDGDRVVWALLAILGRLTEIERELKRRR